MIKSVEKFLAASSLIFFLGTSSLVASEQQVVDLKRKLQFIQTNFLDDLTAFEGKNSQSLPKIMQLATLIDENAFATCESWLATVYPDFSLNTYKDHPLYSILEAAFAYIDFEADNAEYVTRASIKNIMAIDDYPIRGCMEEVGNAKIFVLGSLNILMGKQDLETHLQKTLLSFLGVMVKRREELFLGFNFEEYLKMPMNKRITQNFDRATEFRFGIVRTILEYMLKKDPRSLSEQLSEKTLTLLRLTPTFLKFFDRTNPFHFTSVDPNLMIETKNFLSYLKAQGKKSLGMTFEEFIVDFRINPQIFRRLKASSAFLPPIPELLRVNKLYEPSTQSVQSTAKAPTKNQRKKQKQKEREKLKKQQKLGIGNSSQVESFKDSSQEVDIDNSLVNPLLSAVAAPQLMIDKEENLTEGRPIFENKTLPEDQSAQTSSLSSYEKEKTALQAASSAVTPKVSDNNIESLDVQDFYGEDIKPYWYYEKDKTSSAKKKASSSSNASTAVNIKESEEEKRVANHHMNKIWDLFGSKTFQTVTYDDIINAWKWINGKDSVDNTTGSSHHPLYAIVNGKRETFGIFRSHQGGGEYGKRYVKYLRDYFTAIGRGESWLESQGYKKHHQNLK